MNGAPERIDVPRQAAALALGLLTVIAVWYLARPLAVLVLGITAAEALRPLIAWLSTWIPRRLAILAVYVTIVGLLILTGWWLAPSLVAEAQQLVARVPELLNRLRAWVDRWAPGSATPLAELSDVAQQLAGQALSWSTRMASWLVIALLVLFFSAYWLIEEPDLRRFALSLSPARKRDATARLLRDMGGAAGGYIRGAAIDGAIMAGLAYVGFLIIGLDYRLTLAAVTFFGELIPYVGPAVAGVAAIIVGLGQSTTTAVLAGVLYLVLQFVEGHLVTPLVMRHQTDLPASVVLFAVFAGASVAGALGLLVAVPLAASARILILHLLAPADEDKGSDLES